MSDGKKHRLRELDSAALIPTILGPALVTLLDLVTENAVIAALVYVLAIVAASSAGGVWYGLAAAVLSLIPFVVFFIPPDGFGFATFEEIESNAVEPTVGVRCMVTLTVVAGVPATSRAETVTW